MGKKLMLNEENELVPWREDKVASQRAYDSAGTTREAVQKERNLKLAAGKGKVGKQEVVGMLSDDELAAEIKKRKKAKEASKKAQEEAEKIAEAQEEELSEGEDLSSLTIAKLKEYMNDNGIFFHEKDTKSKLLARIEDHNNPEEEEEDGEVDL